MQSAPVPVSSHDCANEVWIVLMRSIVGSEIAAPDLIGGSGDSCGCHESKEESKNRHGSVVADMLDVGL